jgi:hypothetical protein
MKKIAVLIPVHCAPKVVMMTLGTWLESCDGSYQADITMAIHNNYGHYHPDLHILMDLPGTKIRVQEINWSAPDNASIIRYSKMHAVSLSAMLEHVQGVEFDNLAILDQDLVFKTDFVKFAAETGQDLVGCYMGDRTTDICMNTIMGQLWFAPKFSVWHLVMSRTFYQKIMENKELVFPKIDGKFFYDTFSRVIIENKNMWKLPVMELPSDQVNQMVEHRWSMSFNFGHAINGAHAYWDKLAKYEAEYDQRFPHGIKHLFSKVGL